MLNDMSGRQNAANAAQTSSGGANAAPGNAICFPFLRAPDAPISGRHCPSLLLFPLLGGSWLRHFVCLNISFACEYFALLTLGSERNGRRRN